MSETPWQSLQHLLPSLVPEERRGKPGPAREAALARARANPDQRIEYVLVAVYASLACGEPREALRLLDTVEPPPDSALARRARACRSWAQQLDRNWYPGDIGADLPDDFQEDLVVVHARNDGDAETRLVEACVTSGPCCLPSIRATLAMMRQRPEHLAAQFAQTAMSTAQGFKGLAEQLGARTSAAWAVAAAADILRRSGSSEATAAARQQLAAVRHHHEQAQDHAGVAATWILEGDWFATPDATPDTTPIAAPDATSGSTAGDPAAAADCYARAGELLRGVDEPRLLGALELRRALLAGEEDDFALQEQCLLLARTALEAAGDAAGLHLLTVRSWILHLAQDEFRHLRTVAPLEWGPLHGHVAEIAHWGASRGSRSFVAGLGRILEQQGIRWRDDARYERAELCFRLARGLLPLHGAIPSWQVTNCLAELDEKRGRRVRSLARWLGILHQLPRTETLDWAAADPRAWLNPLQFLVRLIGIPTGVNGTSELADRVIQWGSECLRELLRAAEQAGNAQPSELIIPMLDRAEALRRLSAARRAMARGQAAEADREFAAALAASRRATAEPWLEVLGLAVSGSREAAKNLLQQQAARGQLTDDIRASLALRCQDVEEARATFERLPLPSRAPTGTSWVELTERAQAHLTNDPGTAMDFATQAAEDFEDWLANNHGDAERLEACDDIKVADLYQTAARVCVALANTAPEAARAARTELLAAGFAWLERLRALTSPRTWHRGSNAGLVRSPALQHWQQALTESTTQWQRHLTRLLAQPKAAPSFDELAAAEQTLENAEAALSPAEWNAVLERQRLRPPRLADLRRHLPPTACLLTYQLVGTQLLGFAVTAADLHHVDTVVERSFEGTIRRLHHACASGAPIGDEAHELAEILLAPFASALTAANRVVIVPTGPLRVLPFHVLPFAGEPLGTRRVISYATSAAALADDAPDRRLDAGPLVCIGDPGFAASEHAGLRRLPGAAVEAQAIGRMHETRPFVADAARLADLRTPLRRATLVHIAAHGRLDELAAYTSSIVLADRDQLRVSDLVGMRLQADLVVLSACDSGRGTATLGGDLLGLTRGLFAAGVRRCVVSLWPVNDIAAAVTMVAFHQHMQQGSSPAKALALAQDELRTLDATALAARYEAIGGHLATDADRTLRRRSPGAARQLAPFPEIDDEAVDDEATALDGSHPSLWAPFVLIQA